MSEPETDRERLERIVTELRDEAAKEAEGTPQTPCNWWSYKWACDAILRRLNDDDTR